MRDQQNSCSGATETGQESDSQWPSTRPSHHPLSIWPENLPSTDWPCQPSVHPQTDPASTTLPWLRWSLLPPNVEYSNSKSLITGQKVAMWSPFKPKLKEIGKIQDYTPFWRSKHSFHPEMVVRAWVLSGQLGDIEEASSVSNTLQTSSWFACLVLLYTWGVHIFPLMQTKHSVLHQTPCLGNLYACGKWRPWKKKQQLNKQPKITHK